MQRAPRRGSAAMPRGMLLLALLALHLCARAQATAPGRSPLATGSTASFPRRSLTVVERGEAARRRHVTVPCNPRRTGSPEACRNSSVHAAGSVDFPWGHASIRVPSDGTPWGAHISGPYPDGTTYLLSWMSGDADVGSQLLARPARGALVKTSTAPGAVSASVARNACGTQRSGSGDVDEGVDVGVDTHAGSTLTYTREYEADDLKAFSYLSPYISHVLLEGLLPGTRYYYAVGHGCDSAQWSQERSFVTLPASSAKYPLRIGLMGDVGQTENSSQTRDAMIASQPDVVILVGDNSYADNYDARSPDVYGNKHGSNQRRWDSYAVLWEPLFSMVPVLNCIGNHEIEEAFISAEITPKSSQFGYSYNYPFQAYAARYPAPGTPPAELGDIGPSLWYRTVLGGAATLLTLNNYVPFHPGSEQHAWAARALASVRRADTPWLIVQFHAAPYHSYAEHYKEAECFMAVYEDMFYEAGVDVVIGGHVHAYERTHPVYRYSRDACAPMYVTVGDGGNIEGPVRHFVDDVDPATGRTYCEGLTSDTNKLSPIQIEDSEDPHVRASWGPVSQTQVHEPGCPSTSFQPGSSVDGRPPLMQHGAAADGSPLGFCQAGQPEWSAYRDPSFGIAMLTLTGEHTATLEWWRNGSSGGKGGAEDGGGQDSTGGGPEDRVELSRAPQCALTAAQRRVRLAEMQRRR